MNWAKILIAAIVVGIVTWLVDFVLHGLIMGGTYVEYKDVFSQEAANPIWFLVVSVCVALFLAILFAKTRDCWGEGVAGGAVYGFWIGLLFFFGNFYYPLVIEGFPYFLAWCWGGMGLINAVIAGAVLGLILKRV